MILGGINNVKVGIGLSGVPGGPQAKLHVENDASPNPGAVLFAGYFHNGGSNTNATTVGVYGVNDDRNRGANFGGDFGASNAPLNFGVSGSAMSLAGTNYGVFGQSSNAQTSNEAVHGEVISTVGTWNLVEIFPPQGLIQEVIME